MRMCRLRAPRALSTPISCVRLLHAEQHDIHDADAGDRQGEQADDLQQPLGRQSKAIDDFESLAVLVHDQGLFIRRIEFVDFSEHLPDLPYGRLFHRAAHRLEYQDAVIADVPHDAHDIDRDDGAKIIVGKVTR